MFKLASVLFLTSLATSAMAGCVMTSSSNSDAIGTTVSNPKLCQPMGDGAMLFAMQVSMIDVPSGGEGGIAAGAAGQTVYYIFDNTCKIMGIYGPPNCDLPASIQGDFLDYTLILKKIDTALGGGYFSFAYGNGEFSIGNNHCTCQNDSEGVEGKMDCACAFPKAGLNHS